MRTIQISTDVFAALWAARQGNEQTEDEILRTLLKMKAQPAPKETKQTTRIGFADSRNGVSFTEGFEIFRNYLGTEYRARAIAGKWVRADNGQKYDSLNTLNQSIGAKFQNAWRSWYCMDNGKRKLLHDLRDRSRIHSRALG